MNYQMLKILIDSLIKNFKCPNCQSNITQNNLEVVWAAWTSINLDVNCPVCEKHTFVKAEISQINLWNIVDLKKENIDEIKQKLSNIVQWVKDLDNQINDKEILQLRDILKCEHIKVEDLFGE